MDWLPQQLKKTESVIAPKEGAWTWSGNDLMQSTILSCILAQEMDIVGAIGETLLSLIG